MKNYLIAIFVLLTLNSIGQVELRKPLTQFRSNNELIKKHNIKSLTVFADLSERDLEKKPGESGKLMEMEFDSNGNQIYKLISNNHGNAPFLTYGRGSEILINSYNESNLMILSHSEDYKQKSVASMEYDEKENLTSLEIKFHKEVISRRKFVWSNGKMVKSELVFANDLNKGRKVEYDEKGRIIEDNFPNSKIKFDYGESEDTLYTTRYTYRFDTLVSTSKYASLVKVDNQVTHYQKKNHLNQLQIEMKAEYDAFGNTTFYYYNNLKVISGHEGPDNTDPPITYVIKNVYDNSGLLIKRMFNYTMEGVRKDVLVKIERYFYDTDPLVFKYNKGDIRDREIEMENYHNGR
ncbi:MAG: hypothetical protein ACJASQ_003625 [Crocinitomicaceae bacterium]|jgi:hypothetical protein